MGGGCECEFAEAAVGVVGDVGVGFWEGVGGDERAVAVENGHLCVVRWVLVGEWRANGGLTG